MESSIIDNSPPVTTALDQMLDTGRKSARVEWKHQSCDDGSVQEVLLPLVPHPNERL